MDWQESKPPFLPVRFIFRACMFFIEEKERERGSIYFQSNICAYINDLFLVQSTFIFRRDRYFQSNIMYFQMNTLSSPVYFQSNTRLFLVQYTLFLDEYMYFQMNTLSSPVYFQSNIRYFQMNICIFRLFLLLDWVLFLDKSALYVLYIWFPSYTAQLFLELFLEKRLDSWIILLIIYKN